MLLNPLPYRDPARLAVVWSDFSRLGGNRRAYTAPALFFDWRERSRSFEGIAAFTATNRTFTALDEPLTPLTHEVTPNFFDVAGVHQSSRRRESFGILARDLCSNRVDLSARLRYRNTIVMPRYFETLRTPILSGRSISDIDAADSLPVAVISQSVAKRYFPKGDPVGRSFRLTGADRRDWRIIGIAQDTLAPGLTEQVPYILYFPHAQMPVPTMSFVMRTRIAPMAVANAAERSLWSLGKLMNVYYVMPLEQNVSNSYWQSRFTMSLLAIFAALALLLATVGVYGVMSHLAAQRTQEIGIRIAIGASASDVVWLVTNQGLQAAVVGLAVGIVGYLAMSRMLAGQLFGVSATDPLTCSARPPA